MAYNTCYEAAKRGHIDILKYAHENGCHWNGACAAAAEGDQFETLKWLRSQKPPCPWDTLTCYEATRKNHLKILKYARENGCPWIRVSLYVL